MKMKTRLELKKYRIEKHFKAQGKPIPEELKCELTSGDEDSPDSDISEKGLPDADLNYLINDDVLNLIIDRR